MARVNLSDPELERTSHRKFSFNARYGEIDSYDCYCDANVAVLLSGVFYENVTTDFAVIHQKMYVHQQFIRLLVVDFYAEKRNAGTGIGGGVIHRQYQSINQTTDIKFLTKPIGYNANWYVSMQFV
jgi:hypothetical protein